MTRFNSLVGRATDLGTIDERFEDSRVVTILGPAGVGKTRLAAAYIEGRTDATWCELLSATTAFDVCAALGRVLDVPLSSSATEEQAIATLRGALEERAERLIVLDNFEHVAEDGVRVVSALSKSTRLLVTSQARLRIPEEVVFDLEPLNMVDAQQLFVDRAKAVRADYQPDEVERSAIHGICKALDGLPLAIELAAARIRVLSAVELEPRLQERFTVVTSGDPTQPSRHSTLRAALDWSWALLSEAERYALAQCSCFADGFTIDAAEAVIEAEGPVIDVLQQLRDKSFVTAQQTELGTRFGLYLSIRDYAAEHLDARAEQTAAFARHTAHFLARGLLWAARAEGREAANARAHLEAEQANLLLVLRRAVRDRRTNEALTVALALQPILMVRGPAALRSEVVDTVLALAASDPGADRRLVGWARLASGDTKFGTGQMQAARAMIDGAIEDALAVGDERLRGRSLWRLGTYHWTRDDHEEASVALLAALDVHRAVGDRIHEGRCLTSLGIVALDEGDLDLAGEHFENALDLLEAHGDERWVGRTIGHLGALEDRRGNLEEARQLYLSALAIHERLRNRRHLARVLAAVAALDLELGNTAQARIHLERARTIEREVPNVRTASMIELHLGRTLEQEGDIEAAKKAYRFAARQLAQIDNRRLRAVAILERARLDERPERRLAEARALFESSDEGLVALAEIVEGHALVRTDPAAAAVHLAKTDRMSQRSALIRRAARRLRTALANGLPEEALVVGDGWFKSPGGTKTDIRHRKAPAALLAALATARHEQDGTTMTVDQLFEVGWPGERALPEAAKSRVYVAISTLRKLGLKSMIVRDDDGYRLDPNVPVLLV